MKDNAISYIKQQWRYNKVVIIGIVIFLLSIGHCIVAPSYAPIKFVGSINSNKYHYSDCQWAQKIKHENKIWFDSNEDAERAGYRPCKTCDP